MGRTARSARLHAFKHFKKLYVRDTSSSSEPAAFVTLAIEELNFTRSTLGYAVGEQVLELCAERLIAATRDEDIVITLGGDTFSVVLRGQQDVAVIRRIAERLIECLLRSYLVDGHLIDIEVRAGIATSLNYLSEVDGLLSKSSLALRAAQQKTSKDPFFFEPSMEDGLLTEQALVRDLRRALPLRQFTLHYQPQVDTERQAVTGLEALLRWHHPIRGNISPATFIPLAESTGAIHSLGAWALRTACKQAALLPEQITMAVNVSPLQMRSPTFLQEVRQALRASALEASRLELEITEGIMLDPSETTLATVQALTKLGVRFAIDDFGTGYSCLGQIGRLPFHKIKIDRSLVGSAPVQRAVVRAVVALADGLDMSVLAEGVETEQDLAALEADGCSMYQGYFFGRPIAAEGLAGLMKQIRATLKLTHSLVRGTYAPALPDSRLHLGERVRTPMEPQAA